MYNSEHERDEETMTAHNTIRPLMSAKKEELNISTNAEHRKITNGHLYSQSKQ
jgi:hypothetical protein